ncbi:hypothetical protein [Labilibacter marinus]|uniref:hypothetical protein n=1 Tax=Labilibacter marinus TaxID=1477105 RepID=UPI000829FF11|nr:hypothetical protein [Labilibacter marinus]
MKNIKKLISFIIGVVVALLLLEGYYQVVEIQLPYHRLTKELGKSMNPSKRISIFKEGFYLGQVNQFGYLGYPYPPYKDDNSIRIGVIGDSHTEGFHMFEDYHFTQLLEERSNNYLDNRKVEVLNFGVGNYNYNDMIILYKNLASKFNCDYYIFVVEPKDFSFRNNFVPSPILAYKDSLVIDYSFVNKNMYKLYNSLSFIFEKSCIVKSMNNAYKLSKRDKFKSIIFDKFYQPKVDAVDSIIYKKKEIGIDTRITRSFDWLGKLNTFFIFKKEITPNIKELLDTARVNYSCVYQDLLNVGETQRDYYYWDVTNTYGHWNYEAQEVVSNHIFNVLRNKGCLKN